jgi:hypothetical protein
MHPRVSLREALDDPALLGGVLAGNSWRAWRVLLIAAMGEELTGDERVIFHELTKRDHEPGQRIEQLVCAIGRRGGKSSATATLVTYLSGLCDHPELVRGERGIVLCVAADTRQALIVLDYVEAAFQASPILSQLIEQRTQWTLRLKNNLTVEVRAADYRNLRGPTYVAAVADEVAFWMTSDLSSNPDTEILKAIEPGLLTTRGPLIMISSPYARRGELWRLYDRHFGPQGDELILVAQAASRVMNSTLSQSVIDRAYEKDPSSAAAEFGAQFRSDLEAYISVEAVRACISHGVFERPKQYGASYAAFVDPSGGSSDSMTLAVAHYELSKQTVVVDLIREYTPPFAPSEICAEIARELKRFGLSSCIGDKYAGEWVVEQFRNVGVSYEAVAEPKSSLYSALLAAINSHRVDLLDHGKLVSQLTSLERRTSRTGRADVIDHPPNARDDVCNCVAGVVATLLIESADVTYASMGWIGGTDNNSVLNRALYYSSGGGLRLW